MRLQRFKVIQVQEATGNYQIERRVSRPEHVDQLLRAATDLPKEAVEVAGFLALNIKNDVIGLHIISKGVINQTLVSPREVFQAALLNNASAIILFHNHPSGDTTPSDDDVRITKCLIDAGEIIGVSVLDHIIIAPQGFSSLKQLGYME